jgi:hypothetical protein
MDACRKLPWSLLEVSLFPATLLSSSSSSRTAEGYGEMGESADGKKYASSLEFMARFFSEAAVTMLLLLPMLVTLSVLDVINSRRVSRRAAWRLVEWVE